MVLGESSPENKIYYRLVNTEEKNHIKNNDKSIAALEGKNLLYDNPHSNDKFYGNMWKYHKSHIDYQRKKMLKEKFAKQFAMKKSGTLDKTLGRYLVLFYIMNMLPLKCLFL